MERVYAFTDEYGSFGWDLDKPGNQLVFIISAVIVKESDLHITRQQADIIRTKYFCSGEMKSKNLGKDYSRRAQLLSELLSLPFFVLSVVFDKQKILDEWNLRGLLYKPVFYKNLNNRIHRELRLIHPEVTVVADEIGTDEFKASFSKYFEEHKDPESLFGEAAFQFENSKNEVPIQAADIICGSLGHQLDPTKNSPQVPDFLRMLSKRSRIEYYPKNYEPYELSEDAIATDYDKTISQLSYRLAVEYDSKHNEPDEFEEKARLLVLKHLLYCFRNYGFREYVSTKELRSRMAFALGSDMSEQWFRTRVIAKLRDEGVIIASSPKGYKLPSSEKETHAFILHGLTIINPMLGRLKLCRDKVWESTMGAVDVFDHTEYATLKKQFGIEPETTQE